MRAPLVKKPGLAPSLAPAARRECPRCAAKTAAACTACAVKPLGLQRKLVIGTSNDPLETEADRAADRALARRVPHDSAPWPDTGSRHGGAGRGAVAAPESVHHVLAQSGRRLDGPVRRDMGDRFGHDFEHVRVHDGAQAGRSARELNAKAYTVGRDIVFGPGEYRPHSQAGRRLLAHELAHTIQQGAAAPLGTAISSNAAGSSATLQRKVILNEAEMGLVDRTAFVKSNEWTDSALARSIMDDMAESADIFDFATTEELRLEIVKRISTVKHQQESQPDEKKNKKSTPPGFGYPFTGDSKHYGPRVNWRASDYWTPGVPDKYEPRVDTKKNKLIDDLPRNRKCEVYGDQCGRYHWNLSETGKKKPFQAISFLFAAQPPRKRTLFHCDYLISAVQFLSFAESIGEEEFNYRVKAFGPDKLVLNWNGFADLDKTTFERLPTGDFPKKDREEKAGFGSLQVARPSSPEDLVIGDHVTFWNHLAYDALNHFQKNAWRLENAILIRRKGGDIFLGHGSGEKSAEGMHAKLAEEFNDVVDMAQAVIARTRSKNAVTRKKAADEMSRRFEFVKLVAGEWRIQGKDACGKNVDMELRHIEGSEVVGMKSPCTAGKLNFVRRPIESAPDPSWWESAWEGMKSPFR